MELSTEKTMHRFRFPRPCRILICTAASLSVVAAQKPHPGNPTLQAVRDVAPNGDVAETIVFGLTHRDWATLREKVTDVTVFKRLLGSCRADWEPAGQPMCAFEPNDHSIRVSAKARGAASNLGGGRWEYVFSRQHESMVLGEKAEGDRPVVVLRTVGQHHSLGHYRGDTRVVLPRSATNIEWIESSHALRYTLPKVVANGRAHLDAAVAVRQHVMATAYKVYALGEKNSDYANHWISRIVFKNSGDGVVRDLRVRFEFGKFDSRPVEKVYPEVIPGQTVVSLCYPVLDAQIASGKSGKQEVVQVNWSYEGENGKRHQGSRQERLNLLGLNQFVFSDILGREKYATWMDEYSNASLLAAWVSRNDDVVSQFTATAIDFARGAATYSDLAGLEWIYNTMLVAGINYGLPATGRIRGDDSFDVQTTQNVRLPVDVIRDKKGTCIDLAILFASMCQHAGMRSSLMIVPGHCFPVVQLRGPNASRVGVEVTLLGPGKNGRRGTWREAYAAGQKQLDKASKSPNAQLVDIAELWAAGVQPPDLPRLESDVMQRWKQDLDSLKVRLQSLLISEGVGGAVGGGQPGPATTGSTLDGHWSGYGLDGDRRFPVSATVTRSSGPARLTIDATWGNVKVVEVYSGRPGQGEAVTFEMRSRTVMDLATKTERASRINAIAVLKLEGLHRLRVERVTMDGSDHTEAFVLQRK